MKKVGVIDNFDSFVFNLVRYLDELEVEVIVMRNDVLNVELLEKCDGILLSPGPGIPREAGQLMECIHYFEKKKPILGVCLGHQAIGEYFGAKLKQEPKPIHGEMSTVYQQESDELFFEIPHSFEVGRYHSWSVDLNNTPILIATSFSEDNCLMSMKHINLPIHGVQFHPESILTKEGRKMIQNWVSTL
jgi:anthranilate synthase component 2